MDPALAAARAQAGLHGKTGAPSDVPVFDRQNTPIQPLPAGWMTWEEPPEGFARGAGVADEIDPRNAALAHPSRIAQRKERVIGRLYVTKVVTIFANLKS
jgi:hypothetical protein